MSLGTEFLQACKEGFASKDSSAIVGFLTDDFLMITPVTTRPRQGFLDLVSKGHNPAIIENVEVIYENADVSVLSYHTASDTTGVQRKSVVVWSKEGRQIL